jgi:hypothetical protein
MRSAHDNLHQYNQLARTAVGCAHTRAVCACLCAGCSGSVALPPAACAPGAALCARDRFVSMVCGSQVTQTRESLRQGFKQAHSSRLFLGAETALGCAKHVRAGKPCGRGAASRHMSPVCTAIIKSILCNAPTFDAFDPWKLAMEADSSRGGSRHTPPRQSSPSGVHMHGSHNARGACDWKGAQGHYTSQTSLTLRVAWHSVPHAHLSPIRITGAAQLPACLPPAP